MKHLENCEDIVIFYKFQDFQGCLYNNIELYELFSSPGDILYRTEPSKLCELMNHIQNCTRVFETIECLTGKEKSALHTWKRSLNSTINYLCENNQLNLAKFVDGNGTNCHESTKKDDSKCTYKMSTFATYIEDIFQMEFDCRIAEDAFGCVDTVFSTCSHDVRDVYRGLIGTFMQESHCFENLEFPFKLKIL
ncbi:uncharacterized protein LOC106466615 [Limulus polyphemus]|uniref:Uncharacterized protein LOC106466615 n=1 Tax=Limulus polyphemus TaxID=6850 RepID=A0ABM1BHY3_LIMPO|nr:uncharacterized protein LOC106466615 [Limulus polyphemus]